MELVKAEWGVSRETLNRLQQYGKLLLQWNGRINLVSRGTEQDFWHRHFIDSLQLLPFIPPDVAEAIDLGSGAGFPGLPLAIATGIHFHLVDADVRKAAFLREVAANTKANVTIHASRAEAVHLREVPLLTCRALAPVSKLLTLAAPLLHSDAVILLLKGALSAAELTEAQHGWHMNSERFSSVTDPRGVVLRLTEVRRVLP